MPIINNINEIISNFLCSADADSVQPFRSGHINSTYLLRSNVSGQRNCLLQRINHHIFTDVEALTHNILSVTEHLKVKIAAAGGDVDTEVLTFIPTVNEQYYYRDTSGDYWRMSYFLDNTKAYDVVETEKQAREAGMAFGRFQKMLTDMPAGTLKEVLPNFHNIQKRLTDLWQAVAADTCNRVTEVTDVLEYIKHHEADMMYFQQPKHHLPKRVIHNDTKFNNVLLNEHDEAQCIIDLDTVMEGYLAFDFGDAIRTIINTAAEDEADINKIELNIPLFRAYAEGYFSEAESFITDVEVRSLIKAVLLLPYMQTVRFLTDYIQGDTYYKIHFAGHNLQRTHAQLQLFKLLLAKSEQLNHIIMTERARYLN